MHLGLMWTDAEPSRSEFINTLICEEPTCWDVLFLTCCYAYLLYIWAASAFIPAQSISFSFYQRASDSLEEINERFWKCNFKSSHLCCDIILLSYANENSKIKMRKTKSRDHVRIRREFILSPSAVDTNALRACLFLCSLVKTRVFLYLCTTLQLSNTFVWSPVGSHNSSYVDRHRPVYA